jgi:tRNA (adenine22-N1)-methyltransferase
MINISKRLLAISKYVEQKDRIVDIGCDHALLDIYLSKEKKLKKIIATDIVKHSIDCAKKTIDKYKITNIDLRCGDGLEVLKKSDNINTIIISGMGYQKIIKILKFITSYKNITKIIIQSNNYPEIIRKSIIKECYFIKSEELVKDKGIIYTIIVFNKGKKLYNKREIEFGPCILKNKGILYFEWLENSLKKDLEILKKLPKKYVISRLKLKLKIIKYNKEKKV